jgi:O-antigen/teichoic acid export membrane protein
LVLKITAVVATPTSLLCLVMFIWGDRLLTLLYGRQYAGNGSIVEILALNVLVTAVAFSFSRALFAIDRAHVDFLVNFMALFIMIILGFWLVRAFGPLGAALGMLGANIVTSAIRAGAFLRLPMLIPNGQNAD